MEDEKAIQARAREPPAPSEPHETAGRRRRLIRLLQAPPTHTAPAQLGWKSKIAEKANGRSAMFFIIVGLVTEYYTGGA